MPFAGARLGPFMRIEIIAVSPMNLCGNNDIMRGFTVEMLKRARGSVIKRLEEANYELNNDKGLARGLAGASVGAGIGWVGGGVEAGRMRSAGRGPAGGSGSYGCFVRSWQLFSINKNSIFIEKYDKLRIACTRYLYGYIKLYSFQVNKIL